MAATLALILRTIDLEKYGEFLRGELEDRELVDFLLNPGGTKIERKYILEAAIIVAAMEVRYPHRYDSSVVRSAYLKEYETWAKKSWKDDDDDMKRIVYAQGVVSTVQRFLREGWGDGYELGFNEAVRRLELISPALFDSKAAVQ